MLRTPPAPAEAASRMPRPRDTTSVARSRSPAFPINSCSAASTPARPSRSASSPAEGRATTTTSWPGFSPRSALRESLAKQALDLVAVNRAADLTRHRKAQSRALCGGVRERVQDQVPARHRTSLPIDPLELGATRQSTPPRSCPRLHGTCRAFARVANTTSGRKALAPLVTAALQCQPPGTRGHTRAEAMGSSSLALLRLVGALHPAPQYRTVGPLTSADFSRQMRAAPKRLARRWV